MEPINLDPKLRNRLTRFLHLGREEPKYYPGCWTSHGYYKQSQLQAIDEALRNGANNVEVVEIILQAHKNGWCTRFETIAFALTKCLLVGSPAIKEATYKAASEICVSAEQMLTFNNFTWILGTGNGQGWCKHVRDWYLKQEPLDLAKEVTRVKSRHGRSHKILLRKSHVKLDGNDHARSTVLTYALFGLNWAKLSSIGKTIEGKGVMNYIQKIEDFRRCEDPTAAAAIIEQNAFSLEYIPGHLLTSQEVWNAVLPQLSLQDLLMNIQRLHNMGFLTDDSTTTAIVISLMSNENVIEKSKLTPLAVYIAMVNYQKKSKPLKCEKAKVASDKMARRRLRQVYNSETGQWDWNVTKRHPKEIKTWGIENLPNLQVIEAMHKLIDQTWLLTPPTNARYMITMDMRHHMFKGRHFCKSFTFPKKGKKAAKKPKPNGGGDGDAGNDKLGSKKRLAAECFHNRHVTPGHAAIILALQILKREKNVQLAVFTNIGIELIEVERTFSNIAETEFILRKSHVGRVQLDAPIEWARRNNKKFDVFIDMVDRTSRYMELDLKDRAGRGPGGRYGPPPKPEDKRVDHCPARALLRYRNDCVRNAKLIVMSLASHRAVTTDGSHGGILDIVGIDEHVPKVMDAFVLGQFE